jgi:hypothetical protein
MERSGFSFLNKEISSIVHIANNTAAGKIVSVY